jgi:hypothetical protein
MKDKGSVAVVAILIIIALAVVGIVVYVSFFMPIAEPPVEPLTEGTLFVQIQNDDKITYYEIWIDEEKAERGITLWPDESHTYNFTFEIEDCTTYDIMVKVHIGGIDISYEDSTTISVCVEPDTWITYWTAKGEFLQ